MNTISVLEYGHRNVVISLEGLSQDDWLTARVCGVWSVKDIIAHLATFEYVLVDVLRSQLYGEPMPTLDRMAADAERFNDDEVARRHDWTVEDVWKDYADTYVQNVRLMAQIPVTRRRKNGMLPWYGMEYDLEDFIIYSFYGHKREHAAQIMAYRNLVEVSEQNEL